MNLNVTNPLQEREIQIQRFIRDHSITYWLCVEIDLANEQAIIAGIDRRLSRRLGYHRLITELKKKPLDILIPERYHAEHDGYVFKYFNASEPRKMGGRSPVTIRHRDDTESEVHISLHPFEDVFCDGMCLDDSEDAKAKRMTMVELLFLGDITDGIE